MLLREYWNQKLNVSEECLSLKHFKTVIHPDINLFKVNIYPIEKTASIIEIPCMMSANNGTLSKYYFYKDSEIPIIKEQSFLIYDKKGKLNTTSTVLSIAKYNYNTHELTSNSKSDTKCSYFYKYKFDIKLMEFVLKSSSQKDCKFTY